MGPSSKPPPRPFFLGRTLSAREEALGSLPRLVAFRPRHGHAFTSPAGTTTLYLPPDTLVSVSARRLEEPGWSALEFVGNFHDVNRPPNEWLSPIASEDADSLVEILRERYSLPRCPVEIPSHLLSRSRERRFVSVVDEYKPRHPELPNFAALSLTASQASLGSSEANRMLRATGFVYPGVTNRPDLPRVVGYSGPFLRAIGLQDPSFTYPFESATGARICAYVGNRGSSQGWAPGAAATVHPLDSRRTFTTLLSGVGERGKDVWAVDVANLLLYLLFASTESATTAMPLSLMSLMATGANLGASIERSLDRSPLPHAPGDALKAVASRLGAVYGELHQHGFEIDVQGAVACVEAQRITLLRRGLTRVYRLREGHLSLVAKDSPQEAARPVCFGDGDAAASTTELEGRAGDRIVVLSGAGVHSWSTDQIESSLREPRFETMIEGLERGHPSAGAGDAWGAQLIDL